VPEGHRAGRPNRIQSLMEKPIQFVIIENEVLLTELIVMQLESTGRYRQEAHFRNVAQALAELPDCRPDVILTDWRLGDGVAGTVMKAVGAPRLLAPWLLFTATPTALVINEALKAGISGAVSKMAGWEELAKGIDTLAAGKKYFDQECLRRVQQISVSKDWRETLSETEVGILIRIHRGLEAKAIAEDMGKSYQTILNGMVSVRQKTGRGSMVDLARFAEEQGIVSL
jgi:DNA-binding NarL/FixJ family response regulator